MPEKIRIARLSLKIGGLLFLAAAALFLFILVAGNILVGIDGPGRELLGSRLLGGLGVLSLAASGAAGVLCLKTASGVERREKGARTAGLGLAFLMMPLVPFGPILAAFVLSGLLGQEARTWFGLSGTAVGTGPGRVLGDDRGRTEEGDDRGPSDRLSGAQ